MQAWRSARERGISDIMKGLLKFITCGSVDDGKSTLIGHMLYDAKLIFADQKNALELDSRTGNRDGNIDYSLLLDGLMAEREQGITIDVAYRYFTTKKRSFIVADTPGHEEYTRNMAVGASFADLALILTDISRGLQLQTKRHARICKMMGIRHFLFAVNKMDLVSYDENAYRDMEKSIKKLAIDLELDHVEIIPVSATEGDNITHISPNMKWYRGKNVLEFLEEIDVEGLAAGNGALMPIQRVCRPNRNFRGFQGEVMYGDLKKNEMVTILPSGENANISELFRLDKATACVKKGEAVTIVLDREIDASRGAVIVKDISIPVNNMFTAMILWMDDEKLIEGKNYLIRIGTVNTSGVVMSIKYKIDIDTGEHIAVQKCHKNELVVCDISLSDKVPYAKFEDQPSIGGFILIDRVSNMTSGCGVILHGLRRGENLTWQAQDITRQMRSAGLGQRPITIWFTGLSGAGKSTLANALEKRMYLEGKHTIILDGDNIRLGLNKNLGFTEEDRIENIRRIAEVSKLMNDAGIIVLTAFISPYRADRESARKIIGEDNFMEIYVSTDLETCEKRDVKGLYRKARQGEIPNFTGISSPYEAPYNPDITVNTAEVSMEEAVNRIFEAVSEMIELK